MTNRCRRGANLVNSTQASLSALAAFLMAGAGVAAQQPSQKSANGDGVRWHDVRALTVEGRGWPERELKAPFDRLPAKAEGKVRSAVWSLSHDSAGICVRFATDSPDVHCRWTLLKAN